MVEFRPVQEHSCNVYRTISGSEGFALTWLTKSQKVEELEGGIGELPDFWDDAEKSQQKMKELKRHEEG